MVEVNKKIPAFKTQMTSEQEFNQRDFKDRWTIFYFYPKDNTSGCTKEAEDFKAAYTKFKRKKAQIFGISRDSIKSHEKFKAKLELPFELISDPEEELCNLFDVMKEKSMYGKKYMGIERSTFIIGPDAKLRAEWRKVKVPGHVDEVLERLKSLI